MKRNIVRDDVVSSCYFRTSVKPPHRKVLLQITERCNLHCAHCFISAVQEGAIMNLQDIKKIIPRLKECNTISITLTDGEPFTHPDIIPIIKLISDMNLKVSICTNATLISELQMQELATIGQIHVNVSLDGFRPESHGKFRGDIQSFEITKATIELLGKYQLLHGLLVTPNNLASVEEYAQICQFAINNGASYVLMNPLSKMGRGILSKKSLEFSDKKMEQIRIETTQYQQLIQIIYVRFPNAAGFPLGSCEAGNIIYIFTKGEMAICPYLVFAAKTPQSQYSPDNFIVGNIFTNKNIVSLLKGYKLVEKYPLIGYNNICQSCRQNDKCSRGCPAAIIASGERIESLDYALCPTRE
ncbi:MAG: hypothetical protein US31_C0006G0047 [Berkelbacteria bacterium GW2011_GWA1_36_9]|uniref:Radical SAM core domain-containing protein n=1 Tax=Berkelbacteria bacterium GW2011_GWA1_36_9 TaxID=1618331 RepID=A0A0G0IQM0_9BACT|nr:MAG: hypothetical protein US31_C0006G0047 [Berkelbacteria bacterium GW2011_GWA1_36_9]